MPTELIASVVANGTTVMEWGYRPWLPFYNFIPIVLAGTLGILVLIAEFRGWLMGAMYSAILFSASFLACLPTWLLWTFFEIGPDLVFINWLIWFMILYCFNLVAFIVLKVDT